MNDRWTVQLPPQTYFALLAYLEESGSGAESSEVAAIAIDQWIAQARLRAETTRPGAGRGYQWKNLFLPTGTRLRMSFGGKAHYAAVDGDEIVFEGESVSPAQMANRIAGGIRNAWRDLWIQVPGEKNWKTAGLRRRQAEDVNQQLASNAPAFPPVQSIVPDDIHVRRLANILERALAEHGPQYRRRTDHLGAPFEDH